MTPHMQPNDSPLKKSANTLNGLGRQPNSTSEASARATERMMKRRRFSRFSSEITLMPMSLARK